MARKRKKSRRRNPSTAQIAIASGVLLVAGLIGYGIANARKATAIGTSDKPTSGRDGEWRWTIDKSDFSGMYDWSVFRGVYRHEYGTETTYEQARDAAESVIARLK